MPARGASHVITRGNERFEQRRYFVLELSPFIQVIAQTCKRKNKKDEKISCLVLAFIFVLESLHLFIAIYIPNQFARYHGKIARLLNYYIKAIYHKFLWDIG